MNDLSGYWKAIAEQFSDGQTFSTADAAEALRPHVNPMVAIRAAERFRARNRSGIKPKMGPEYGRARSNNDITQGLRCMAGQMLDNRLGRRGARALVHRVSRGRYQIIPQPPSPKGDR